MSEHVHRAISRRDLLRGASVSAGALAASTLLPAALPDLLDDAYAAGAPPRPTVSPAGALKRLANGNRRFVRNQLRHPRRDTVRRARIAQGQTPYATVLCCADSRVPPEIIYDEGLGDLFIVRVAGNTGTDPLVIGSIEYGATVLGTTAIIVLGHSECGAVKAAIDVATNGTQLPGDLPAVVAPILPVVQELAATPKNKLLGAATTANVERGVQNLTAVPLLADLVTQKKLVITGGVYELKSGKVSSL